MRNKALHRAGTLLLALILVIMPVSGFHSASYASDPTTDPSILMPWGVRWDGPRRITWEKPIGASSTVKYSVTLVTADNAKGSGAHRIRFLPVDGYRYTFDPQYFEDKTKYYRAEVSALKPGDAQISSYPAYTEYISGKRLTGGFTPLQNADTAERITLKKDQKIARENRINLDIDRSQYVGDGTAVPAYEQVILYGYLPTGMDYGFGEAETPYLVGTPTNLGRWHVDFAIHLSNGQNILDSVEIIVLPQSMEYNDSTLFVEKGKAINPVKPIFTGVNVGLGNISSGNLPPGLAIDFEKGVISGTPTKAGKYVASISGWDQYQYQYFYNVTFMVIEHKGSYATEMELEAGKKYSFYLTPHVAGHYEKAKLVSGTMPPGMTWKESEEKGVQISGTPTQAGKYELLFQIINAKGEWNYVTLYLTVFGNIKAVDLYEVDLTGSGGQLTMKKADYEKILKGTLDAAVKGQQIQYKEVKVGGLNVTSENYDLDNDNKYDITVLPSGNNRIISMPVNNWKKDDFFLDLNEASIYAAKLGSSDYAETTAFRVEKPVLSNPFTDIDPESYCYEPVLWAYHSNPQITKGLSDDQFGPGSNCTRAQIVTFLWRAAGCPEPTKKTTKFKDVNLDSWYGKAVLWAVEKGITSGKTENTFVPDGDCTRAEVVTFLFRFDGKRIVGDDASTIFKDLNPAAFYSDAVDWAVKFNIAKGITNDTFGPGKSCTRGQIATFLYRLLYSYNKLGEKDFLMYVDDFISVGDGVYGFEGTVTNGSVRFGSRIRIQSADAKNKNSAVGQEAVVSRIQVRKGSKYTDVMEAAKGQHAMVYVYSVALPEYLSKGDALIGANTDIRQVNTNVCGTVTMESASDPNNELREGMKPSIYVCGDVIGTVSEIYGGELKKGQTGENVLWINFQRPMVYYVGQEVSIRKANKTCGKMIITKVGP